MREREREGVCVRGEGGERGGVCGRGGRVKGCVCVGGEKGGVCVCVCVCMCGCEGRG